MPEEQGRFYHLIFLWMIILGGSIFFSCQNEDCVSIYNNDLLVGFLQADTLEDGRIQFNEIDTVFYTVRAVGNDTIYYDSTDVESLFVLPVDPAAILTTFQFEVIDSITYDTLSFDPVVINTIYHLNPEPHFLTISYDTRERIISEDCGVEISYSNVSVEETSFPFTNVVDNKLSRFNEVNVEIIF